MSAVSTTSPPRTWPKPFTPRISARSSYALHAALARNRAYRWLAGQIEAHPRLDRWFTRTERISKERLFGCAMCGQCELPTSGYACPMSCPKQLRNGPCGGVGPEGQCEVYPEVRCVWVEAYERAEAAGHGEDLDRLQRPVDQRRWGTSSWVNYWSGRDEDMSAAPTEDGGRPLLHRELGLSPR